MGARRAAWGSMAEVSPGVWRIRFWGKDPATGEYRRRSCTVRGSRRDAERRRAELMVEHSEDAPCPTVGQAWERWYLPDLERRVSDGDASEATLRTYRFSWARVVEPRWAGVPLDAVRPLEVQQWLDRTSRSDAEAAMRILRPLGDYGVRFGAVAANPWRERYLMPSRSTVRGRDRGSWTLAELGELWRGAALGQWWEAAFLLSAFGGLRTGEALGVLGSEVYESRGCAMVPVVRQVTPRGISDRLKTPQSRRVVPMPGAAGTRILGLAAAGGFLAGDGLGGPSTRRVLGSAWDSSGAGHPFQNLRAAWQTWMRWEMRVEPWAIEAAMGHLAPGVTGRHYDRPQADAVAEVISEAYAARPYDAGWSWAEWDDLGRASGVSAGQ